MPLLGVLRAATLSVLALVSSSAAAASTGSTPAAIVRGVLSLPDDQLDYGRAKLAFDRIVDPPLNVDAILAEIDGLAESATALAGADASQGRITFQPPARSFRSTARKSNCPHSRLVCHSSAG